MAVHLVNLTNPMMMKGPFRELIPVEATVQIKIPANKQVAAVHLIMAEQNPHFEMSKGAIVVKIPKIIDHEIGAVDFK